MGSPSAAKVTFTTTSALVGWAEVGVSVGCIVDGTSLDSVEVDPDGSPVGA